jgi:hypothetical protein
VLPSGDPTGGRASPSFDHRVAHESSSCLGVGAIGPLGLPFPLRLRRLLIDSQASRISLVTVEALVRLK